MQKYRLQVCYEISSFIIVNCVAKLFDKMCKVVLSFRDCELLLSHNAADRLSNKE